MSQVSSALRTGSVKKRIARHGTTLPTTSPFAAYFADTPDGAYQLEQWIPAFERLAEAGTPITLLVTNANSASRLLDSSPLPILLCSGSAGLEAFVKTRKVQVLFYVNNNQANFTPLRLNNLTHVHLSHGESEKSSMVSNQLKAYDRAFIAGLAARERILAHVRGIDPSHLVEIGRPQLDGHQTSETPPMGRLTVLYAPTWEGDSDSMAYSSLASIGPKLVNLLGNDPRIQFKFRAHPKTGSRSLVHREHLRLISRTLGYPTSRFARRNTGYPLCDAVSDIRDADVVVTDISAMAMDAVGLNKPTLILAPPTDTRDSPTNQLMSVVPTWSDVPADAVSRLVALAHEGANEKQREFREHVFGANTLGSGTERFIHAAHALISSPATGPSNVK